MNKILSFLRSNWKDIFKPIIVLTVICIIIPLALALTNKITAKTIEELSLKNTKEAMQSLVDADEFSSQVFATASGENINYSLALQDEAPVAYIFTVNAKGYGGDVSVMTAVSIDGKIIGVDILDASNETPGLGQNVTKESFYSQFKEKTDNITVVKNGADGAKNEINAVTGATISSRAVTSAVNTALGYYGDITESQKGGAEE